MTLAPTVVRLILGSAVLALSSYAYYAYIRAMVKGEVKPVRITWIMLLIITMISLESQREIEPGLALALTAARVIGAAALMLMSIKYGRNDYHWSHLAVVAAVITCLTMRIWVDNHTLIVCCTALADLIATMPTIIGAWQRPEAETPGPWVQDALAALLDAFSVTKLALGPLVYPLYLCGVCTAIATIVVVRTPQAVVAVTQKKVSVRTHIVVSLAALALVTRRYKSTLHLSHPSSRGDSRCYHSLSSTRWEPSPV